MFRSLLSLTIAWTAGVSVAAPSLVSDAAFEEIESGCPAGWRLPSAHYSAAKGEGQNGSGGLVWVNDDPEFYQWPFQSVRLEAGKVYRIGARIKFVFGFRWNGPIRSRKEIQGGRGGRGSRCGRHADWHQFRHLSYLVGDGEGAWSGRDGVRLELVSSSRKRNGAYADGGRAEVDDVPGDCRRGERNHILRVLRLSKAGLFDAV